MAMYRSSCMEGGGGAAAQQGEASSDAVGQQVALEQLKTQLQAAREQVAPHSFIPPIRQPWTSAINTVVTTSGALLRDINVCLSKLAPL